MYKVRPPIKKLIFPPQRTEGPENLDVQGNIVSIIITKSLLSDFGTCYLTSFTSTPIFSALDTCSPFLAPSPVPREVDSRRIWEHLWGSAVTWVRSCYAGEQVAGNGCKTAPSYEQKLFPPEASSLQSFLPLDHQECKLVSYLLAPIPSLHLLQLTYKMGDYNK